MQETKKGKFIVMCEHFCSYPEPKKLYGNDRKLFDILIQNYDTDIMLLHLFTFQTPIFILICFFIN